MKQRPILFNADMVRALLDGRKTQTRRLVKPAPGMVTNKSIEPWEGDPKALMALLERNNRGCPYGKPGDRLWVREAHALLPRTAYRASVGTGTIEQVEHPTDGYTAAVFREGFDRSGAPKWRPSIHMPRWASRITLEVVSVRVERLNDISAKDALEEGIALCQQPQEAFRQLWESIHSPEGWSANPWVWVVEFKRLEDTDERYQRIAS
ncbi:hypothetical protein [Vreelandella indica]|uniref:hypothetical protein n=1 Tax=Vreelandella indica TaxID=3126500 RepID=UPI00300DE169